MNIMSVTLNDRNIPLCKRKKTLIYNRKGEVCVRAGVTVYKTGISVAKDFLRAGPWGLWGGVEIVYSGNAIDVVNRSKEPVEVVYGGNVTPVPPRGRTNRKVPMKARIKGGEALLRIGGVTAKLTPFPATRRCYYKSRFNVLTEALSAKVYSLEKRLYEANEHRRRIEGMRNRLLKAVAYPLWATLECLYTALLLGVWAIDALYKTLVYEEIFDLRTQR